MRPVRIVRAHHGAYLLKVPEHVFRRCYDAEAGEYIADAELGSVPGAGAGAGAHAMPLRIHFGEIHTDKVDAPPMTCELRPQASERAPVYPYTEKGEDQTLTGKVSANGVLQMPMSGATMSILKKRAHDADVPKRAASNMQVAVQAKTVLSKLQGARDAPRDIRVREDTETLKERLLALFTPARPYWTMNELIAETQQPTDHIRAVMMQVGKLNQEGENRHRWELKPEYGGGL